jgi:hypothetical protein
LKEQKRRDGRFFGRRVNCEYVPFLPASVVALFLNDPRKIPYLLVWKGEKWPRGSACPRTYDGEVNEVVRLSRYHDPQDASAAENYVKLKRMDGDYSVLRIVWRMLPRNGARALFLFCPYCQHFCRAVYGWQVDHWGRYTSSARLCPWRCRACAGLRYASEGGALVLRSRWSYFRMIEQRYGGCRSPRPEPWYPYVFTSVDDPRPDEFLGYHPASRRSAD